MVSSGRQRLGDTLFRAVLIGDAFFQKESDAAYIAQGYRAQPVRHGRALDLVLKALFLSRDAPQLARVEFAGVAKRAAQLMLLRQAQRRSGAHVTREEQDVVSVLFGELCEANPERGMMPAIASKAITLI